jgi:putative ABC transport system ATP-binding protein
MDLIAQLHKESGVTVILATHDESISERASRRIKLRDGRIVSDA